MTTTTTWRFERLDAIRGAAVLLMLVDHVFAVAVQLGASRWFLLPHLTVTRFALPGFMVTSGVLWHLRGPSGRRQWQVFLAACVSFGLSWRAGLDCPDVLAIYAVVLSVAELVVWYPFAVATLGFLQALNWPIHWDGYQPGWVMGWLALGVLLGREVELGRVQLRSANSGGSVLHFVGRWPLSFYLCHVAILVVVVVLLKAA